MLAGPGRRVMPPLAIGAMAGLSLVPLTVAVANQERVQWPLSTDHRSAAAHRETVTGPDSTFVVFDVKPYAAHLDPAGVLNRAPAIQYLMWPTSRTDEFLAELPDQIATADAIVADGGLSVPVDAYPEPTRAVRAAFDPYLSEFSCVTRFGTVTVRTRDGC
jgi:hypothetical protein